MHEHAAQRSRSIYDALGATRSMTLVQGGGGCHNMGTARMSDDPADGVTNRWGRVHDIPNLFVSDGSLFPSSGAANPTLTIVALAIRQADHIAAAMSRREI
jgi:choline dehydrogenase-like flavoprotein